MIFLSSISDMYFFSLTYISEEHLLGPPTAFYLINFGYSGSSKDSSLDKDIISPFFLSN